MLASPHKLKSFDLKWIAIDKPYQETIEKFSFEIKKDGTFHGFCAYFDVEFRGSDVSKILVLSTAPEQKFGFFFCFFFLFNSGS